MEEIVQSKNKSIGKTLAILSTFTESEPMQRTSDIANKLKLNVSTVSRHLNTLLDGGYLERDDNTGFYYPGINIVALAGATLHNRLEYRYAYPQLHKISNKYLVHGHMGIRDGIDVVHLISACCEYTEELSIPMGHRQPLYCTAMGRVILSSMSENQVNDVLKNSNLLELTPKTIIDKTAIKREVERVKKQGYSIVRDELLLDKVSIAAPLKDTTRKTIGAVSISTSVDNLKRESRQETLVKAVVYMASKISGQLGYYPTYRR